MSPRETAATTDAPAPAPAPRPVAGLWARVALACAALGVSGWVRAHQAERIRGEIARGVNESITLDALPDDLGPWRGEATKLDPQIARGTGAKQIVTRKYVNRETGVTLDVIFLFGQAVNMFIHTPELCYPSAGYSLTDGPQARTIDTPSGPAPFRALVYSKGEGARAEAQEVYYSWRYNGRWSPEVGTQKHFERISGMYKVHVARPVAPGERRDVGNPCEAFLRLIVPEIDRRAAPARP